MTRTTHRRFDRLTCGALGLSVALGLASALPVDALADSLRCDGQLVRVGDAKARLLSECGQPASKDIVAVQRLMDDGRALRVEYVETWSYAVPNTAGFQVLRFEAGRLVGDGLRCNDALVEAGDTTVTVLQRCGEPATRDASGLAMQPPGPAAASAPIVLEVPVERWVYDPGPGSLLRIVELQGGRVTAIEDGPRHRP